MPAPRLLCVFFSAHPTPSVADGSAGAADPRRARPEARRLGRRRSAAADGRARSAATRRGRQQRPANGALRRGGRGNVSTRHVASTERKKGRKKGKQEREGLGANRARERRKGIAERRRKRRRSKSGKSQTNASAFANLQSPTANRRARDVSVFSRPPPRIPHAQYWRRPARRSTPRRPPSPLWPWRRLPPLGPTRTESGRLLFSPRSPPRPATDAPPQRSRPLPRASPPIPSPRLPNCFRPPGGGRAHGGRDAAPNANARKRDKCPRNIRCSAPGSRAISHRGATAQRVRRLPQKATRPTRPPRARRSRSRHAQHHRHPPMPGDPNTHRCGASRSSRNLPSRSSATAPDCARLGAGSRAIAASRQRARASHPASSQSSFPPQSPTFRTTSGQSAPARHQRRRGRPLRFEPGSSAGARGNPRPPPAGRDLAAQCRRLVYAARSR